MSDITLTPEKVELALKALPRVFSAPVAEALRVEMEAWLDHGHRFGAHMKMERLCDNVLERERKLDNPASSEDL